MNLRFSLLFFALISSAWALESDREQQLVMLAENAKTDGEISVLLGNVSIQQGSLKINAGKAEIYYNKEGAITKVSLSGCPVMFEQKMDGKEGKVETQAKTIDYLKAAEKLILQGKVWIYQDGVEMTGKTVKYDLKSGLIEGSGSGSGAATKGRVKMVLPPRTGNNKKSTQNPARPVERPAASEYCEVG